MKLIDPTDDELNAAFATEVCDWHLGAGDGEYWMYWYGKDRKTVEHLGKPAPEFTQSADLVLPWLYKRPEYCELQKGATGIWMCVIGSADTPRWSHANKHSPAKCVVVALLRAHGIEIEFT